MTILYMPKNFDNLHIGKLCKRGHNYAESGGSLRRKTGHCYHCYRITQKRAMDKRSYKDGQNAKQRERYAQGYRGSKNRVPIESILMAELLLTHVQLVEGDERNFIREAMRRILRCLDDGEDPKSLDSL